MRSFIRPRKKKLLDDMSLLWLVFIIVVAVGLVIFGIVLHYKSSFYIRMLDSLGKENSTHVRQVQNLQQKIALITTQGKLVQEVESANVALKESMQNLFDLIPDQITLTRVVMDKNELYIKGYTRSRESYKLLLEPPLKSIFTRTEVKFYKAPDGRLVFESRNTIADNEMEQSADGNRSKS